MAAGFFAGSPLPSIGTHSARTTKNTVSDLDSYFPPGLGDNLTSFDPYQDLSVEESRRLPGSRIKEPDLHDLVLLAATVEGHDGHNAGHVADKVCRFPSSIIGTGATFVVRAVRVPCKHIEHGFVVTKSPRLQGSSTLTKSDFRKRVRDMIFELRVLRHPPLMRHPNIINLLGISWVDDVNDKTMKWPTLVLEYGNAGTLHGVLMAGKLEFLEKRRACFEVGLGLSALHQCGIVHSDVKCENVIMFQDENGVYTAKIADFGCSTSENPDGARLGGGTPPWTAPEWKKWIRQGHLTKTDIYSFGLLVWRVMAGGTDPLSEVFASEHTQHTDNKEDTIAMFEKAKQEERLLVLLEDHCSRVLRGHCSELPKQVLRATVLLEPDMRNLANALDVLRIPDAYSEVAKRKVDSVINCFKENATYMSLDEWCSTVAPLVGIQPEELVELRRTQKSDDEYIETFRNLAETKHSGLFTRSYNRIDELRVLGMPEDTSQHQMLSPGLAAREVSSFSTDHLRMMQPAIQKQVVESLSASANVGNRDSALYLATIHLSVRYKPEEAMRWLSRAAELGSSTAAYLYYRLHEATGVEMEKDRLMVSQWLYQGSAWGSWIAFDDFIEFEDWAENIAKTILMWQGSFNGDIPFREEALTGRFTIQPVGTRLELLDREIAAAGGHVHDIILAGRESNRLLHWAAGIGSSEVVAHLIDKHGASVNCLNRNGETPLLAACRAGNGRGVVELMMRGADKSIVSHSRQTPLHWLWTFEKSARHMRDSEKLAVLTDLGRVLSTGQVNATADAVTERINGFKDEQSVHRLQSHLLSDLPLGTPLHWAVQRRCLLTVQALLKIGANPFVPVLVGNHRWGGSAAHLAAAMHDDDIFQLFVDSVAPEPERHRTIFEDASELFPGFLDTVISGSATRTHANGRFERMGRHGAMYRDRTRRMLRLLVDNGVTKLQGQYKMEGSIVPTPLFLAVMHGQTDIAEAMLEIPEFQADLEVACGLYTSAMETPLLKSVSFCNADMYFLLRSHGANTNVTTHGQATTIGDSALSLCAYVGHEQMDVALDLIKSGNPVNSGCSNLMSPIFWAALGAHFHLAELLLTHGAEINELQDWRTKKLMTLSLDEPTTVLGLLLRTCSISTALPLQWLFESHDAGKFTLDPIICPSTGATVFHAVAAVDEAGRDEEVLRDALLHIMSRFAGQSDLVNAYAYHAPDSASRHGTTPLIDAVRRSNLTVAKALVNAGADIFKTCTDGYQPLQYAKSMLFKFESLDVSVYSPKTLSSMEKSRDEMLKLLSPTDTSST